MRHYTRAPNGRFASKRSMAPAHGPNITHYVDIAFDSIVGLSLIGMSLALAIYATGAVL